MRYNVFTRNWWRNNSDWPNGLEPHAGPKRYMAHNCTEEEARGICREYNKTHNPRRLSREAEYEGA